MLQYPIRDKWLLVKSGFTLIFVITLFFLHSFPNLHLSLGWTALLGVLLLLILADSEDLDGLMARVEWSTLLFFASLFILMEVRNITVIITFETFIIILVKNCNKNKKEYLKTINFFSLHILLSYFYRNL